MPESVVESVSTGRPRRGSLGLLRRSKSHESTTRRSPSDGKNKLVRKSKNYGSMSNREDRALSSQGSQREAPRLPTYQQLPRMATPFEAGENNNPTTLSPSRQHNTTTTSLHSAPHSTVSLASRNRSGSNPNASYYRSNMDWSSTEPPVPPVPDSAKTSVTPEPPARTESMTHRGRYSYASSPFGGNTNSPRRVRRRKDPTPFNVLVVGTQACGKTAFIEFLRKALYRPTRTRPGTPASSQQQTPPHQEGNTLFTPQYVETEYDGERIGLTIYDSKGLDTKIIDLQLRELSRFVESKFQDTFFEERKVLRAPGAKDTHIHCVFMILEPARLDFNVAATGPHAHDSQFNKVKVVGALDERVDVELLRVLQGKTTVIPVISKADTITTAHMSFLKRTVSDSLKKLKIDPLEALNLDSDEEEDTEYDTASSAQHSDVDEAEGRAVVNAREDEVNDKDVINNLADPSESKTESSAKGDSIRDIEVSKDKAKASQGQESKRTKVPTELDPPHLPLSIISPDMYDPGTVGRRFPWGFADPYNADHCDFVRLKDNVFGEWRTELQEAARDRWYEGWRTSRLDRAKKSLSPRSSQQRAVSNAAAYGGKSLESTLSQQPTNGSSGSRTVSASNIGVAISNTGGGPPLPKTNYRGVGTY